MHKWNANLERTNPKQESSCFEGVITKLSQLQLISKMKLNNLMKAALVIWAMSLPMFVSAQRCKIKIKRGKDGNNRNQHHLEAQRHLANTLDLLPTVQSKF